jgi:hypothetical protein
MRSPARTIKPLRISEWTFQAQFHSQVCALLRHVKWERDQAEQELLLELEDKFFGDFKDPWFEGEDLPGYPSITRVIFE